MRSKKGYIILVAAVITFGLLLVGGTYAWLILTANVTNASYVGETTCFYIDYDITNDDGSLPITGTLFQSSTPKGGLSGKVSMNIRSDCSVSNATGTIKLNISSSTSSLLLSEGALKYAVYKDVNVWPVSEGVINSTGDMVIYQNFDITHTPTNYYIYVWLDGNIADNRYVNLSFSGSVHVSAIQKDGSFNIGEPNLPSLDSGMIPVKIANDGTVTTVASNDSTWYNYNNKEWANAVLVKESGTKTRNYYKNNTNIIISESDILAYYVWIPRYKYKIWDTTGTSSPQTIDIEFESVTTPVSNGTTVGSWRTHPAFVFGDENLSGIWVGKFETTGDGTTPTVLPNSISLVSQNVNTQFVTSLKFAGGTQSGSSVSFSGNSTYGLTTNNDSHMMKNSEWGAVAYLSHSEYGVNTQIRINNFSDWEGNYYTGCGALEEDADFSDTCEIQYGGASSYPQSTTGNITGVFDMSGGAWEYVMGNYNNTISSEGCMALMVASKYYDSYTSIDKLTACNGEICYGHAFSETKEWYEDEDGKPDSDWPWFSRGGGFWDMDYAGAFNASAYDGSANSAYSWRSVLVVR